MSVYKREDTYYIELRWRGYPRIRVSAHTGLKEQAEAMQAVLRRLREKGRRDLLELLAAGRLEVDGLVASYEADPEKLEQAQVKAPSPPIGELLDEWYGWLASAAGISAKTRRRFAPNTIRRYQMSWQCLLSVIKTGRETALGDINDGLIADYRAKRVADGAKAATVNRDLCAIQAFLSWCTRTKHLRVIRPEIIREREPSGRERWLTAGELRRLQEHCPETWWPLFATLVYTGLRVGEAQGLRGEDVRFTQRIIRVTDEHRSLKTASSQRDVPMPEELATLLAVHFEKHGIETADLVFPPPFNDYRQARRVFLSAYKDASLAHVTIHDLRHTFGVHCILAGVPVTRLQRLLGHATPYMALRYAQHAPQPFFEEDAARLAESLGRQGPEEADERAKLAQAARKAG